MAYQQKGNFKVFVYLGAIVDPNPPVTVSLDFSKAVNSQYLSLFAYGLIGKISSNPPTTAPSLNFSQSVNSQYLALLSYGVIGN